MKRVLIDTGIFIDFLRSRKEARALFEDIMKENITAHISVMTEAELFSGKDCDDSGKRHFLEMLLHAINRIEVDSGIARRAGDFTRAYKTPLVDSIIAATSVKHGLILYTRNTRDFRPIKEVKLEVPY